MSEDQKPVAPTETTATSENASQPEQPVAAATPITPPSSKLGAVENYRELIKLAHN